LTRFYVRERENLIKEGKEKSEVKVKVMIGIVGL